MSDLLFRNLLRNPSFAINQRGVSGSVVLTAGSYGHDGVKAGAGGATYTFATSGLDTTLTITAGSLILPIEGNMIEGNVVEYSTYTLRHEGTAAARIWQGTGNTGSGVYQRADSAAPLGIAGLSANTQTNVEFSVGTILRPQFEPGAYATAFERRPPGVEMGLCRRYYQRISAWVGSVTPGGDAVFTGQFSPEMSATPTIYFIDGTQLIHRPGVAFVGASSVTAGYLISGGGFISVTPETPIAAGETVAMFPTGGVFASAEI